MNKQITASDVVKYIAGILNIDLSSIKPSKTSPSVTFATPFGVPVKIISPIFKVKYCET